MIIARTIALALLCASTRALSPAVPLHVVGDNSDCALYLSGPGRTSVYDYSINLLKGNFGYEGQSNCITYEAINQAYLEARNRILVSQPKGDWKAEDFASVGELVLDISTNIARRYGLTYEEIEKGLPLIDTSRTLIREVCPPIFSHVECRAGKYRRLDGLCNNIHRPTWGSTMAPFQRLIGPLFADGINSPRIAHHGRDLPLSRVVSRTMHPDEGFHDHAGTVMVIAWGQFMDHDYTLTGTPLDPKNRNDPEECCNRPPHLKHPYCNEIRVPDDDYFYRLFNVKCIDFVRGFPSPRPGCRLGSRVPFNTLTGTIDGNTVYGVTEKFARKLRTGFGGLLRMNPVFKDYGLKDLLPLKLDIPEEGCTRPNNNMYCFEAGEIRVNEQLVLTVMHTLMAREHNRVANALAEVNPHWDDETLFQEARRINIAEIQHITYNEFLPILLGKDVMEKFGLVLEKQGYWDGYDPEVNPDVIDAFASAAYRFGHSLLPTAVERWSKAHKFIASKRLSDLIRRPFDLYRAGVLDEYVMGLMNQVAQAMDDSITQEVTNHLFKKAGARFGMDLVSFNMQRGREFGIPGYMEYRKFCGLPNANTFQDLFGSMPNETVQKYETIFDHPIDVDLWSGGVSERPLSGSMLGPTFACIIATQFSYSRRGDRFWFELPNQPSSFTPEQLVEIKKSRLARVICDNTDIIDTVQLYPMVLPDHELNPRVPCRSGILPQMDFSKWAEPAPFHGSAKQFITQADVVESNTTEHKTVLENQKDCSDKGCNKTDINTEIITVGTNITDNTSANNTIDNDHKDKNLTIITKIPANDTILKYVYKNEDKVEPDLKTKGHPKNQLKRRKRSIQDPLSPLPSKFQKPALIVNYETSHGPPSARAGWTPPLNLQNIINEANRADFKIESTHGNTNDKEEDRNVKVTQDDSSEIKNEESDENIGREQYKQLDSREDTSGENDEQQYYGKKKYQLPYRANSAENNEEDTEGKGQYDASKESSEKYQNKPNYKNAESDESVDSDESNHYTSNYEPYIESGETKKFTQIAKPFTHPSADDHKGRKEDYRSSNLDSSRENVGESSSEKYIPNSKPNEARSSDREDRDHELSVDHPNKNSRENIYNDDNYNHQDKYNSKYAENSQELSTKNSNENEGKQIDILRNKDQENDSFSPSKNRSSLPLQDIDLGDFSYERINVSENGKVVAVKDSSENINTNSDVEILSPKNIPGKEIHDVLELVKNIHKPLNYSNKLVSINDGEVKPVVEINTSDEDSSEEISNSKSNTLESLNDSLNKENTDDRGQKTYSLHEHKENANVKQQYERIPTNYNHDHNTQIENPTIAPKAEDLSKVNDSPADNGPKEDVTVTTSEGSIDAPDDTKYDEHLKMKFDDLQINLPEIKLPDDILGFTKYNSPFEDNDEYSNSQYKDQLNERKNEQFEQNEQDDKEDVPSYYGYYGDDTDRKQNVRKGKNNDDEDDNDEDEEDEDDEDEDLYEKFVRERFGKSGTFGKRSENLKRRPRNPQLTQTIQNILKKTATIDEQAKKSGDPKAGYMWTLEYGEDL